MVKRCIGIDVGSSYLCAVQIMRIGKAFCIEKVYDTQARRETDYPSDILKKLVGKYGFDRRAAVAISVPNNTVFFRNLKADSVGSEQTDGLSSSVLEYDFPIEPDEIVAQPCSYRRADGKKKDYLLTAAVAKESLNKTRDILLQARMQPDLIGAAIFAIHSTIKLNHPEIKTGAAIIVYLTESHITLAVTQNNSILIVRNFPIVYSSDNDTDSVEQQVANVLSREAGITWRKLFGTEIEQDTKIFLVTGNDNSTGLKDAIEESLQCRTIIVNPYARVLLKNISRSGTNISVAEGLALRTLAPEHTIGIDFLEADNANAKSTLNLKRELIICVTLVAAIAVVSLVGLFMRLSSLEAKYAKVKNEIKESFQRVLPEEKNIVNPLAQLDQKLQSLRKDYTIFGPISGAGIGPLDILYTITKNTPTELNISLKDMLITTESVRLTATSQSSDSAYNWQRRLQSAPQFSTVDIRDIQLEPEGERVHFTVLVSFATKEQK
jgi:Tfp pilus assembly PilM family ATPase